MKCGAGLEKIGQARLTAVRGGPRVACAVHARLTGDGGRNRTWRSMTSSPGRFCASSRAPSARRRCAAGARRRTGARYDWSLGCVWGAADDAAHGQQQAPRVGHDQAAFAVGQARRCCTGAAARAVRNATATRTDTLMCVCVCVPRLRNSARRPRLRTTLPVPRRSQRCVPSWPTCVVVVPHPLRPALTHVWDGPSRSHWRRWRT
jgi:hypothetical protein